MISLLLRLPVGALLAGLLLLLAGPARAQREYFNWYFGQAAGLSFLPPAPPAAAPTVLLDGRVNFSLGAASISSAAGQFLFASDGYQVWDRNWAPLPGRNVSQVLRNYSNNARQVLALPQPGSSSRFYVFVSQREFYQNEYPVGGSNTRQMLPYVIIDTNARGGLGGIVGRDSLELPKWVLHVRAPIYGLTGNWAAVRHANGQDLWLVGISSEGQYVSWLFTSAGLARTPVVSLAARWLGSNGILRASPDGRRLAALMNTRPQNGGRTFGSLELADFNPATGQVSGAQELPTRFRGNGWYSNSTGSGGVLANLQGLEFSPDGSRLYADSAGLYPLQYNLLAGSAAAVDASCTPVRPAVAAPPGLGRMMDMKLGPDGKIYCVYQASQMACISVPNALGDNCRLAYGQPNLQPRTNALGTLPLSSNDLNLPPVVLSGAGSIAVGGACVGETVQFTSSLSPFITARAYAWDFGDPASGALNTASGQAPVHTYQQAGQYTVTLRVTALDGRQYTTTQQISITSPPVISLGPDRSFCPDGSVVLTSGPQPAGSTYLWQDGSTSAQLTVRESGTYRVTVTLPSGCAGSAEVILTEGFCTDLPNVITPNGDGDNDVFVLKGMNAPAWRCRIFSRWGRLVLDAPRYLNDWSAAGLPAGVYYYELMHSQTGQRVKGTVEVLR